VRFTVTAFTFTRRFKDINAPAFLVPFFSTWPYNSYAKSYNHMSDENKCYLGYLDKEMSIMGILSTFCLAVPSLVVERLESAKDGDLATIWSKGKGYFCIASVLMLVSAALFFKQRSLLAFYYGQIAKGSPMPPDISAKELKDWKDWAHSWTTWIPYHAGFWTAITACFDYALGFLSKIPSIQHGLYCYGLLPIAGVFILLVLMVSLLKDRPILLRENAWVDGVARSLKRTK
jgi:hypothetical protein